MYFAMLLVKNHEVS